MDLLIQAEALEADKKGAPGKSGGSGIVILRHTKGPGDSSGGSKTTSGGATIHTFTSSGTFTA